MRRLTPVRNALVPAVGASGFGSAGVVGREKRESRHQQRSYSRAPAQRPARCPGAQPDPPQSTTADNLAQSVAKIGFFINTDSEAPLQNDVRKFATCRKWREISAVKGNE